MLILDIEWLLGLYFAARSNADAAPDWPPQPDRIFSALTASWGARGARQEERAALEWLESQPPPDIEAVDHEPRTSVTVYVPPNDATSSDVRILPDRRRRQPRQFPAVTLHGHAGNPHLRLIWQADPSADQLAALRVLARDTSFIGHSSSLIRCTFADERPDPGVGLVSATTTAAPYPGRIDELEVLYRRHVNSADPTARPGPALLMGPKHASTVPGPGSLFGERWIVFEFVDGDRPDLRAAAMVGRRMRDALMSTWPDPIPEWVSGHAADGTPSRAPHLAVVPLGDVGFPHSGSARESWHGLALVLPRAVETEWTGAETPDVYTRSRILRFAVNRLASSGPMGDLVSLRLGKLGEIRLAPVAVPEAGKWSLRPSRYTAQCRVWSTATPIALDRHTKTENPREEAAEIVAESCTRIGLPRPAAVHIHKHAAIAGAPSAWPPGGAPHWTGWTRPETLANRPLMHATLQFKQPVAGPIILGAGRFFGLGLCLPIPGRPPS